MSLFSMNQPTSVGSVDLKAVVLDWEQPIENTKAFAAAQGPFDLILVSECVYLGWAEDPFEPLLSTLRELVTDHSAVVLLAFEERGVSGGSAVAPSTRVSVDGSCFTKCRVAREFFQCASKRGFVVEDLSTAFAPFRRNSKVKCVAMKRKAWQLAEQLPDPIPSFEGVDQLALQNAHPLDSTIVFVEQDHTYYVKWRDSSDFTKTGCLSVSGLVHSYFPQFDAAKAIQKMKAGRNWNEENKYWGLEDSQIQELWHASGRTSASQGSRCEYWVVFF